MASVLDGCGAGLGHGNAVPGTAGSGAVTPEGTGFLQLGRPLVKDQLGAPAVSRSRPPPSKRTSLVCCLSFLICKVGVLEPSVAVSLTGTHPGDSVSAGHHGGCSALTLLSVRTKPGGVPCRAWLLPCVEGVASPLDAGVHLPVVHDMGTLSSGELGCLFLRCSPDTEMQTKGGGRRDMGTPRGLPCGSGAEVTGTGVSRAQMSRSVGLAGVEDASENLTLTACSWGEMCRFRPGQRCGRPDPRRPRAGASSSLLVSL